MEKIIFYCVKTWSTCKKAKAWLEQKNISFDFYDLLKEPLSPDLLREIASEAEFTIKELINPRSQVFKKMDLDMDLITDEKAINLMIENPRIIKRPIITGKDKVIFAFKEEEYQAVFG